MFLLLRLWFEAIAVCSTAAIGWCPSRMLPAALDGMLDSVFMRSMVELVHCRAWIGGKRKVHLARMSTGTSELAIQFVSTPLRLLDIPELWADKK